MRIVSLQLDTIDPICAHGRHDRPAAGTFECEDPPGAPGLPVLVCSTFELTTASLASADAVVMVRIRPASASNRIKQRLLQQPVPAITVTQALCIHPALFPPVKGAAIAVGVNPPAALARGALGNAH